MEKEKTDDATKPVSPRYDQAVSLNGHTYEENYIDNADSGHTSEVYTEAAPKTQFGNFGGHHFSKTEIAHTDFKNQNHGIQDEVPPPKENAEDSTESKSE